MQTPVRGWGRDGSDHGVVEHLRLERLSVLAELGRIAVGKLPADGAVSDGDRDGAHEDGRGIAHNVGAHPGEGAVGELGVGRREVLARLWLHLGEAREEVEVRDADVLKEHEAVVGGVVAGLGTDVADGAAGEDLARLDVADGDDKGVGAVVLSVGDELCHDDGVVCGPAEAADPPLGGGEGGAVDLPLLRLGIQVAGVSMPCTLEPWPSSVWA